jgi:multicomponent Na+:H+ antiporter subunit G
MTTWLAIGLILVGAFFSLVAALGILRMPDLLMRMHAATKAGTLGAGLMLLAAAVALADAGVAVRAGAAIVFLLLTAPVAAHVIGRAAYRSGQLQLWEATRVDELRGLVRLPPSLSTRAEAGRAPGAAPPTGHEPAVRGGAEMAGGQSTIGG